VEVLTVNVAEVLPAGIVTEAGIDAAERLLERAIFKPPAGAGPLKVTVPVDDLPPTTLVGFSDKPIRVGGLRVREADSDIVPSFAVTVAIF